MYFLYWICVEFLCSFVLGGCYVYAILVECETGSLLGDKKARIFDMA